MSTETYAGCRFYVEIDGIPQAVFTEIGSLNVEVAVEEVQEGGNNGFIHRLPGQGKVNNLTLKRGMTKSNDFYKWHLQIAQGTITRRNISVVLYNTDATELLRWNFLNAYPVKWTTSQFRADDKSATIETLELAHDGIRMD